MDQLNYIHRILLSIFNVRIGDEAQTFYFLFFIGIGLGFGFLALTKSIKHKIVVGIILAVICVPAYVFYRASVQIPVAPDSPRILIEYVVMIYIFFSFGWIIGLIPAKLFGGGSS